MISHCSIYIGLKFIRSLSLSLSPVIIDVKDPVDLLEIFLRTAVGEDVEDDHELSEVDVAVVVGVVDPEDVLLQLVRVGVGVALLHHLAEVAFRDLAVGMPEECRLLIKQISVHVSFQPVRLPQDSKFFTYRRKEENSQSEPYTHA